MSRTDAPPGAGIAEAVLCDSELSLRAHKELFRFDDGKYAICETAFPGCLAGVDDACIKLHISGMWEGILRVALWRDRLAVGDVLHILKDIGMSDLDLAPFSGGAVEDIFPVLYYGKNFDCLRKVCNAAKRAAEERLKHKGVRVDCHLVSPETERIVASSL